MHKISIIMRYLSISSSCRYHKEYYISYRIGEYLLVVGIIQSFNELFFINMYSLFCFLLFLSILPR